MATAAKNLPQDKKKKTPEERDLLLKETRALLNHWMRIREYLLLAFQNDPITRDQEQVFLELKSDTARSQRVVSTKIPEDLKFGGDKITDFLRQAISVAHLRGLPMADKRGLVSVWHVASVMLHRAVGALEYVIETHTEVRQTRSGLRGIKAIKSEAAGRRKKSNLPKVAAGLVVVAAALVGLYFLFQVIFG